jgi:signal transduction histidine kinase
MIMDSVVRERAKEEGTLNIEITTRFGLLPNFFCTASATPGLINELWGFARSAYLDSPLPSLFKERLFVYLSRFCPVRYCIIRHVGFLIGKGNPAGDPTATPETVDQVFRLLKRRAPDMIDMDVVYRRLNGPVSSVAIPAPESQLEGDLFDALAIMFVEPRKAEKARMAIKHSLGEAMFELVTAYLAFIRTAHYWTETHPELLCEPDMLQFMDEHPELGALLLDAEEAERIQAGDILRRALNESQEKYRTIFNSIDEGFALCEVIVNTNGKATGWRVLEANPSYQKAIGGRRASSISEGWIETLARTALERETIRFEKRLPELDRWFSFCASPTGEAAAGQFVLIVSDITERKWLEQQKEDFLSIASHELKTPVTSIKAYGQLLERSLKETDDNDNSSLAQMLNAQVSRLNSLISDLLDTTKITEGQLVLELESIDVTELIRFIVAEFRQIARDHELVMACESPVQIHADRKRIEQVITNLLSNAVKYSPEGGLVSVGCQVGKTDVKISIADNGIGIPAEAQDKIFNRFFRVKHDRTNMLPGMGLGLYICAGIIHRHGGTIEVKSKPGGGSIFYFTLPLITTQQ